MGPTFWKILQFLEAFSWWCEFDFKEKEMCYFYVTLAYINSTLRYIGCVTHVYETHMLKSHTLYLFVMLLGSTW
jgi:hypothetical protein